MAYETDQWEYIPARWQKRFNGQRLVLWIVIHCMQADKTEGRARVCARYFQNPPRPGSAHVTVDNKECIQCVHDNNIAAGAVGANTHGIHIEQPGYAAQTVAEWEDEYSQAAMLNVADVTAQYCLKYDIPVKHLTNEELQKGEKGIVSHLQVCQVWPSTGHTDPGAGWPWKLFINQVQEAYDR